MHPWPSLTTSVAAIVFALIFGMRLSDVRTGFAFLTVLMTQFSISALNDWADRDRDAAAGRWRPIAAGKLTPSIALGFAVIFAVFAFPGLLLDGIPAAIVLVVGLAAGWAYDLFLKPTPLSFVPFAVAFPLLPTWVGLIAGRHVGSFTWLIIAGAFLAIAIHLADSLPDIATDSAAGLRTLAVQLGQERSVGAIVACLILGLLFVLVSLELHPVWGLGICLAALIAAAATFLLARQRPEQIRWIVAAFAIVAAVMLLTHLPDG